VYCDDALHKSAFTFTLFTTHKIICQMSMLREENVSTAIVATSSEGFRLPFIKRFALCYRTVVCPDYPVCLYNVGVLWPNGWMNQDQNATRYVGRHHCVRWGPSSPIERGTAPLPHSRLMSIVAKRSPFSATADLVSSFNYFLLLLCRGEQIYRGPTLLVAVLC